MQYWLFKTEPEECSIEDIKKEKSMTWDGVRNYQARNFLRDKVKKGDIILVYHSSTKLIGVAGLAEVLQESFPDPSQFNIQSPYYDAKSTKENPKWISVSLGHVETFKNIVLLKEIKNQKELKEMLLLKNPRLSIQPVSRKEFEKIYKMSGHS